MASIDPLLERNKHFATTTARAGARIAGPRFEVAVIHHNDCGMHFLAGEDFRGGFADLIGGDDAVLAAEAVVDPELTIIPAVPLHASTSRPAATSA
jgi:hypothetical protein